ncbi:MAG: bifunctional phosphopantothenoylcysteine decarboxylase/phosphopantothenate--cysteine ligase CoaBC [Aerococcus sp.]|nr:bifunctional phosphopantothenoylcysteine decarboxylase/phosphopantothenate--cysteine ligase CoaBC [Aerococcus sp.]
MLTNKKIAVVISGGIAAYKMPLVVRALIKAGAKVRVAMTPNAEQFVTRQTLETLTHYPVLTESTPHYPESVPHIALADWADYALIAPATANTMGKLAQGIADNEALSALLAMAIPTLIVPAMNHHMWLHPAVQTNILTLRNYGYHVLEPAEGFLAEGYNGKGRLPEPEAITLALTALIANASAEVPDLTGEVVAISLGGTEEPIDPVRYLTNRSSGKMGLALAYTAALAGAKVHVMLTPIAQKLPLLTEFHKHPVQNAEALKDAMLAANEAATIMVMAAAVSDYRTANQATEKMKKQDLATSGRITLELVENPDILLALDNTDTYLVGFAAETQDVENYARQKLVKKGADMIIANDVSDQAIGFGSDDNAVKVITKDFTHSLAKQSKFDIASQIWREVKRAKALAKK